MDNDQRFVSGWKAGVWAGIAAGIAAKLALMDPRGVPPTAAALYSWLLLTVSIGVGVGYGWARIRTELEQRRQNAAAVAAAGKRQATALEDIARHGHELRRIRALIEDGALSWGSAVMRGVPRTLIVYDDDVYAELNARSQSRAWQRSIQAGVDLLVADGGPIEAGTNVEGGTVWVLETSGDEVELSIRASSRTWLVVRGNLRRAKLAVKGVTVLDAEGARRRGLHP